MLRQIVFGITIMLPTIALGDSHKGVSKASSFGEFNEQFCAAKRDAQHIFIVPVAVFKESAIECEDGDSKLRMAEPKDDPGHMVFNIDPPSGSKGSFDCDGKADTNMTMVAINCLPVAQESASHPEN